MTTNQPSTGPSQATRVLFHVLLSLLASAVMAGVTAGGNYLYTGGNSINITVVGSTAAAAFLVFLVTHAPTVLKSNEPQLLTGVHDILVDTHQPILTYLGQLMQQTNQIQQVTQATLAQVAPTAPSAHPLLPFLSQPIASTTAMQPQPVSISQLPTQDMPAVPSGGGTGPSWWDQYKVTQSGIPTIQ